MKMLRRGMAMLLSIALVFSLVAVVATPNWTGRTSLGMLSRYYETGSMEDEDAAGVISTVVGDPGGKSFGAYMFTIKSGTVLAFINWCRNTSINSAGSVEYAIGEALYSAYTSGGVGFGPLFDETWQNLAEPAPVGYGSAFFRAQEAFSKTNIYDVAIDMINATSAGKNFDIDYYSVALKNVIWSRAVHHGPEGARDIVVRAFNSLGGFANQSEGELIMAIYNESGRVVTPEKLEAENKATNAATMNGSTADKYNVDGKILRYWYGSSDSVQLAVYRRLNINEPADALNILHSNAFNNAPFDEGSYTITLKKDSSTLALGVANGAIKVVNTAEENVSAAKFTLNYLSGANAYTISTTIPVDENNTKTMRLSATTGSDGVGTVTLSDPNHSDSQLWSIDGDGLVKSKAIRDAYLAFRNDTLVVVGTDGSSTTLTSTATPSTNDKMETFKLNASAEPVEENTTETGSEIDSETQTTNTGNNTEDPNAENLTSPTTESEENTLEEQTLNVTFVAGENGTIADSSSASFVAGESTDFAAEALPAVTAKNGWRFVGWFTENDTEFKVGSTAPAGDLTLYAKYTMTTTVGPSMWTFSPVVAGASDFTLHQLIYPDGDTELHVGDSGFPVRGMIACSDTISRVDLTISGPTNLHDYAKPNASYYDLNKMDSTIAYSSLTEGDYTYKLTAEVDGVTHVLKESMFTVSGTVTPDVSTPSGGDNTFTVTFDAGTNGKCTTKSQTYSLDNVIYGTLPAVTANSGYGFAGWFTAPTGGVEVLPGTQIVAENITLYAQYTRKYSYTFTGASGSSASGSAAAGTIFYAPSSSNAPWKAPDSTYTYTFSHWVDAVGNKYSSGQAIVMGEGNVTFTPVYTSKTYSSGTTTTPPSGGGGGGSSTTTTPSGPVWAITPGVSVSQMEGTVYSGGTVVSSGNVATGMTVKTSNGEYTIAVTGDTSGDGKITVTDVVKLQSHLLNKSSLSGAYLEAADLNGDSKVSITDLVKSARVVAGKDTIG